METILKTQAPAHKPVPRAGWPATSLSPEPAPQDGRCCWRTADYRRSGRSLRQPAAASHSARALKPAAGPLGDDAGQSFIYVTGTGSVSR